MRTKAGARMNSVLKLKIIELLTDPENDGLSQAEIAQKAGVSERTVRNYLIPEVWEDIRQRRIEVMAKSLSMVDRAIFAKAISGDISAAKLIYARWDVFQKLNADTDEINPAEIDLEIQRLTKEIQQLEPGFGESLEKTLP
jgi:transcriptional regulator with XRE-family HTH domain